MKTDAQLMEFAAMLEIIRRIITRVRRTYRLVLLIPIFALSTLTACGGGGSNDDTAVEALACAIVGAIGVDCKAPPPPPESPPPSPPPTAPGQEFDCAAGDVQCLIHAIDAAAADSGSNTINLAAGTYTLTAVNNTTDGPNGLPSFRGAIHLNGAADDSGGSGAAAPRTIIERAAGARAFRLLHNVGGVVIQGISLRGGSTVTGEPNIHGGAIFNRGRMVLVHSTVSGNQASEGFGGGIFNSGTLELHDSTVSDNDAFADGGISNSYVLQVTGSTISNNTSSTGGGGIGNSYALRLVNSTLSGNHVSEGSGGGIFNTGYGDVRNSTIGGNSGGGIFNSTDFIQNMRLAYTIVAGNLDQNFGPEDCAYNGEPPKSLGYNLFGAGTGCPSDASGDKTVDSATVFTDVLGPLQDNGGPTFTHAPLPGSPAIDAGDDACTDPTNPYARLTTDQRGSPRPVDGDGDGTTKCDIGAVEGDEVHSP